MDHFEIGYEKQWMGAEEWFQRARDCAEDLITDRLANGDADTQDWVLDEIQQRDVLARFLIAYAQDPLDAADGFLSDISRILDDYRDWLIEHGKVTVD